MGFKDYTYKTNPTIFSLSDMIFMKLDIVSERYNPFLKRNELVVDIEHPEEPTPSNAQLIELLTKHINKEKECIEIVRISSGRGLAKSKASVFVWDEKRIVKTEQKGEAKEIKTEGQPAAPAK